MKKWAILGLIIIAVGGYAIKANADIYWGINASRYNPHTEFKDEAVVSSLEKNENAETALALIVGLETGTWWLNPEGSYRTLEGFGYRAVRQPGNQVATASYDVTLLTVGNVIHMDNGMRPQFGLYQHTTDGTVTAAVVYGLPSGQKQSSEWGMYYGLGYEFTVRKKAIRLDALYFPTTGDQDQTGAEGDAVLLGVTVLFK